MGHYGIFTIKLCQALAKMGHAVVLCTNKAYPERYLSEPPAFGIVEVGGGTLAFEACDQAITTCPPYYWWGYFRNSYRISSAALTRCRSARYDVVYLTDVEFLTASLLLKRYRAYLPPVVMEVSAANWSFRDYPGSFAKKCYKVLQREVFRTTLGKEIRAISTLGEWHKDKLRTQLKLHEGFPISVIPDGGGEPQQVVGKREARKKLSLEYEGPIFLFFGMLRKDKGIETLVEAAGRLREQEFRLVIAGHPMEYAETAVTAMVEQTGLDGKVMLRLGYVKDEEVPLYFFASDAVLFPYSGCYTGGSGPLMKGACVYGRPVIASQVAELGRLVKEHELGLVCPPDDPGALADRMRQFLEIPESETKEMGERASALAKANSWETMAERFTRLFEEVTTGRRSR